MGKITKRCCWIHLMVATVSRALANCVLWTVTLCHTGSGMLTYTVVYTEVSFRVVGVHRESVLVWDRSRVQFIWAQL